MIRSVLRRYKIEFAQKAATYRSAIPHARDGLIYLDHCAVSPVSDLVEQGMLEALSLRRNPNIDRFERQLQVIAETRQMLADITGSGDAGRIAFVQNTTGALNLVAQGFPWNTGDEILVAGCEFASNVYPWKNLDRRGVRTRIIPSPSGIITADQISDAVTTRTRLLSVSAVQYVSGYRADLDAIGRLCREHNIYLVVDGIQAAGAVPQFAAEWGADAYCGGGHKWLMGPQGIGYLCLSERLMSVLQPSAPGWLSASDPWDLFNFDQPPEATARRFEGGTYNTTGIFGLHAALKMLLDVGPEQTEHHLHMLIDKLVSGFRELGIRPASDNWKPGNTRGNSLPAVPVGDSGSGTGSGSGSGYGSDSGYGSGSGITGNNNSAAMGGSDRLRASSSIAGIAAFRLKSETNSEQIIKLYRDNGIFVSVRSGMLRIAPHFYNTIDEIEKLIEVTSRMMKHGEVFQ